jgi:hypothetical protein
LRRGNTKSCGCLSRENQIAFHKRQIAYHQQRLKELLDGAPQAVSAAAAGESTRCR